LTRTTCGGSCAGNRPGLADAANNEPGTLQPVAEVARIAREPDSGPPDGAGGGKIDIDGPLSA
jgi:hypothetical protein